MFDFLKRTKSKPPTATEWMARFDLERRPFARALLARTSHDFDESYKFLTSLADSQLEIAHEKDLAEFAESSATMFAKRITEDALGSIGYKPTFSPFEPVPSHAPLAFAFGGFVILGLVDDLKTEGIAVDFVRMCAGLAYIALLERPEADMKRHSQEFNAEFQRLLGNDTEQMREWRKLFAPLVRAYVLQWESDNAKLKSLDLKTTFAEMLKSLIRISGNVAR